LIVARAPLRLPLGGGGTDLPSYYETYGGFFVSAAIDKYVYVSVNRPAGDDLIRVKYSRSEEVRHAREVKHDLVRGALQLLELGPSLEIASLADVPAGTGLGSSGSYLAALLRALHSLGLSSRSAWEIAEEACLIEIEMAGHRVGKQDQYVAAVGGLNCYDVDHDGKVTVTPLHIPTYAREDLQASVLLFYMGVTRESSTILEQQVAATEARDPVVVDSLHRTKELGFRIREALEVGDLIRFGALLDEHWVNKKRRSNHITDERIDCAYERAQECGALGGKVLGAGGGGFLMLLCDGNGSRRKVRETVADLGMRYMPFTFDFEGAKVLLNV
jgi:D-glycero-alpha-D-manno-heptose-7-phosphate kinase